MSKKYTRLNKVFLFCLSCVIKPTVAATPIAQPIGHLIQYWSPTVVNLYLEKWDPNIVPGVTDPFDTRYPVSEIQPTQDLYFVRLYSGSNNNAAIGTYMVRPQFIRGLTPQQIKNQFSLPTLPTKIVYVKVPAGAQYGLWTGIDGLIDTKAYPYGNGGGQQTKVIGPHSNSAYPPDPSRFAKYAYVPALDFMNPEPLGTKALFYSQTVQKGNVGKIAAFLDHATPLPYSDMENVYTTLDFVNWQYHSAALSNALNQLSPEPYNSLATVTFRDNLFFNHLLFHHDTALPLQTGVCSNTWVDVNGEQGEQSDGDQRIGFHYQTPIIGTGRDCQIRPRLRVGIGAGYLSSNISWSRNLGSAVLNVLELGVFSDFHADHYFVKTAISTGINWASAQRRIQITGTGYGMQFLDGQAVLAGPSTILRLNRHANSNSLGGNIGLQLTAGSEWQTLDMHMTPTATILYFVTQQNHFSESGANSLDLTVNPATAQYLRSELAIQLSHLFPLAKNASLHSHLQLGWAHTLPLDNQNITARFSALGGSFTVNGYHKQTNSLLARIGISTKVDNHLWIDGSYDADLSHGFNEQAVGLILRYFIA